MKPIRTLACTAVAYSIVLAVTVIGPRFDLFVASSASAFVAGGLTVGLGVTLASIGDRIRINRRLARMTAPLAEQARQGIVDLGHDPRMLLG